MKAFDRLFTDDAIWVPLAEIMDEGRVSIIKDLGDAHNTWAKTTTLTRSGPLKVRQVRPDVAVLLFHLHFLNDGKEVAGMAPGLHRTYRSALGVSVRTSLVAIVRAFVFSSSARHPEIFYDAPFPILIRPTSFLAR
jgi:hypothetical protein